MIIIKKMINLLRELKINAGTKFETQRLLISYSLHDYQESNLENYLSGGCLNNIY